MENYKRFLTYINSYTRGELIRNVGSSKIELREDACRITVNAKGLMNIGVENVYLFRRDKNEMEVTYLGKLVYSNGNYELRVETDRNNILDSGAGFDDFSGILLLKEKNMDIIERPQQLYAGIWDNKPLGDVIRKTPKLRSAIKENTITNSEASKEAEVIDNLVEDSLVEDIKPKEDEVVNSIVEQDFIKLGNVVEHINSRDTEENILGNRVNHKFDDIIELSAANLNTEFSICNEEKVDCMEARIAKAEEMREKFKSTPIKQPSVIEQKLRVILNEYPKMDPFDDESDCVRIEPEDTVDIPVNIWMLVNNIFLKDGYNRFKHLVLIKCGDNYYFGVPGIKCEKEQFMAYLHGFSEFKSIKKIKDITDDFGYWLVKIII
jgi:hypothetical protein